MPQCTPAQALASALTAAACWARADVRVADAALERVLEQHRDEHEVDGCADEDGEADAHAGVVEQLRRQLEGVDRAEAGHRREQEEREGRAHAATHGKQEGCRRQQECAGVAHGEDAGDGACRLAADGELESDPYHEHAQVGIGEGRQADRRHDRLRQPEVQHGEDDHGNVAVEAHAQEHDLRHLPGVHAGRPGGSGGHGVVAAHGHDGVAHVAEADDHEDGGVEEALDEGHGEHADIITGDVDHAEAAAVPVSAACEPAET